MALILGLFHIRSVSAWTEGASVYQVVDLEANAQRGSYGSPDFVRRSQRARVSNR